MSRHLPAHPNLEHLRKQAKSLLREMQRRLPASKLADAQHTIAREYGFASWPKLKVHVESLPVPATAPATASHPFVGTWIANLSRSKRHPINPFQRATIQFDVSGETVTIADRVVDVLGREEHRLNTIRVDGIAHPSEYGNGYVVLARWRGSHVIETVATKDGEVVGSGRYEVSSDGNTLTISAAEQVIVLDRLAYPTSPTP